MTNVHPLTHYISRSINSNTFTLTLYYYQKLIMADHPREGGDEATSRVTIKCKGKGKGKKRANSEVSPPPCGACKYMRRKCHVQCVFAPYFASDQGLARFAIVHKIFGANSVSKMLSNVALDRRHEVAVSLLYEAQARLADPVYGYLSTIVSFQQKVASLQGELLMIQNQLINTRISYATLLQSTQQQQSNINVAVQAAHSNNFPVSTNLMSFFNPGFDHLAMQTASSSHKPLQFSALPQNEEQSQILQVFNNDMVHLSP
ncbi:LOB domain-containing protein 20, partial [Mucuna pruriens]